MAARVASAMELDIYAELSSEKERRPLVNLDGILLNKADNNQAVDPHACEATDHTAGAITGRDSLYCGWTRIIDSVAPRHHTNFNILLDSGVIFLLDSGMTAHQMGSMGYMDPEYMRGSISCQLPSNKEYGGDNQIRNKDFLRFMTDSPTYRTRSSRSLEIDALLQALRCGQTTTRTKWRSRRTLKTDAVQKRESRTHNALLSKRDYNYCAGPENDSTLGSSEEDDTTMIDAYRQGAVPQHADLRLNRSVQTSIQAPEGGTVSSGGSDHPAAADSSSSTRPSSTMPSKLDSWFVATNVACSMTGDGSRLTDYMPTPTSNQVVHVPTYGFMVVIGRGSVRTETMSLHNGSVLHVRGLDKNLVSASQLVKLGYAITFGSSECRITKDDIVVGEAHFNDENLVELDFLRVA